MGSLHDAFDVSPFKEADEFILVPSYAATNKQYLVLPGQTGVIILIAVVLRLYIRPGGL